MRIEVLQGDATRIAADILVLKYAQARFGLDAVVAELLYVAGHENWEMSPKHGQSRLLPGTAGIAAEQILFIGTPSLWNFDYREIRSFGRNALSFLAKEEPSTRTLVLTVHGPGFGLDEEEAFDSQIAGFIDAISSQEVPKHLEIITFAEKNARRAQRLQSRLQELVPNGNLSSKENPFVESPAPETAERLRAAGYASASKAHAFVAMPFSGEFDDVYHYGILNAVKRAGLLCERVDLASFTGDIVSWIRKRVRSASLVIADLSGANPNVYLEVGFAWGCRVPTVLLARSTDELRFDVQGQRCLIYERIKDLEEKLSAELKALGHGAGFSDR